MPAWVRQAGHHEQCSTAGVDRGTGPVAARLAQGMSWAGIGVIHHPKAILPIKIGVLPQVVWVQL